MIHSMTRFEHTSLFFQQHKIINDFKLIRSMFVKFIFMHTYASLIYIHIYMNNGKNYN